MPNIKENKVEESVENVVSKLFPDNEKFILGEKKELDSLIIESEYSFHDHLKIWLQEVNRKSVPKLPYQAFCDRWEPHSFHSLCDAYKHTLVIVKNDDGYIFGGYSDQTWEGNHIYKTSNHSFVFSLKCFAGFSPFKMRLIY